MPSEPGLPGMEDVAEKRAAAKRRAVDEAARALEVACECFLDAAEANLVGSGTRSLSLAARVRKAANDFIKELTTP